MTARNGPLPVPARITLALDAIGAEGPDVDVACGTWEGNPAGDVDAWERGEAFPTPAQVEQLAEFTGMTPEYFYLPATEAETRGMRIFMCQRGRRPENALTVIESKIGWDGVLEVNEIVSPKSPYRPRRRENRASILTAPVHIGVDLRRPHRPDEDPGAPGCCRCKRPMSCATSMHRPGRR